MRLRFPLRFLVYGFFVIFLTAAVVVAVLSCSSGSSLPAQFANSRLAKWVAARVGVEYSIGSLDLGCFAPGCAPRIEAGSIDVAMSGPQPIRLSMARVHWCPEHPVSITDLALQGVQAGGIEVSTTPLEATSRNIQVAVPSGSLIRIQEVVANPGEVRVSGVRAELREKRTAAGLCADLGSSLSDLNELRGSLEKLPHNLMQLVEEARRVLLYVAVAAAALFFGLKLASSGWVYGWKLRLALSAATILVPLGAYFGFRSGTSLAATAAVTFGCSTAAAIAMMVFVYRKAKTWFSRWEPFAIDIAAAAIVLPLFGYHFQFSLPPAPADIAVERVQVADTVVEFEKAVRAEIPWIEVGGIQIPLSDLARGPANLKIASINIPNLKAVVQDQLRLQDAGAAVRDVDIEVDLPAGRAGVIRSDASVAGIIESDVLAKELRNLEYLRGTTLPNTVRFEVSSQTKVDATQCTVDYSANARLITPQLGFRAAADGNMKKVRVHGISTLPGSRFRIRDGSADVHLGTAVRSDAWLSGLAFDVSDRSGFEIDSAMVSVRTAPLSFSVSLNAAAFRFDEESSGQIASAGFHVNRRNARGNIRDVRFTGKNVALDLPAIEFNVAGTATRETIPRKVTGDFAFALSGNSGEKLLRPSLPIRFSADVWKGTIDVPLQHRTIFQSISDFAPGEIPVQMSFRNQVADITVPHLTLPAVFDTPARSELNDLHVRARLDSNPRTEYRTGWNHVTLPKLPSAICIEEITTLDAHTAGSANLARLLAGRAALPQTGPVTPCTVLPEMPDTTEFRISGSFPAERDADAVLLETKSGQKFRIRSIESKIGSLDLLGGRFQLATVNSTLAGIRLPDVSGDFTLNSDMTISGQSISSASSLSSGGDQLGALSLTTSPGQLIIHALTRRGPVSEARANVDFTTSGLKSLRTHLELRNGPLATLNGTQVSLDGPGTVDLAVDLPAFNASASISGLTVAGADYRASLSADTSMQGSFDNPGLRANPVLERVTRAAAGFGANAPAPAGEFKGPVAWNVRLKNSRPGESFLKFTDDRVLGRAGAEIRELSWPGLKASGTAGIDADLFVKDDHLLIDALTPLRGVVAYGETSHSIDLRLPILAGIRERLAPGSSGMFFDETFYADFWRRYQPVNANEAKPLFDANELAAGPISVRQITFPASPLRLALGYGDGVELHAPFAGRVLFGDAEGLVQSRFRFAGANVSTDSMLKLSLKNIQAGAIGQAAFGRHLPFVEDQFDGLISARVVNLPLNQLPDRESLERIDFSAQLTRSPGNGSAPGVIQSSTDTRINVLNPFLNNIIRGLQLTNPPQTILYKDFNLDLQINKGEIRTEPELLKVTGFNLFSSHFLDLEGNFRFHVAPRGERLRLYDVLGMLKSLLTGGEHD